jgi:hypothetical protein
LLVLLAVAVTVFAVSVGCTTAGTWELLLQGLHYLCLTATAAAEYVVAAAAATRQWELLLWGLHCLGLTATVTAVAVGLGWHSLARALSAAPPPSVTSRCFLVVLPWGSLALALSAAAPLCGPMLGIAAFRQVLDPIRIIVLLLLPAYYVWSVLCVCGCVMYGCINLWVYIDV